MLAPQEGHPGCGEAAQQQEACFIRPLPVQASYSTTALHHPLYRPLQLVPTQLELALGHVQAAGSALYEFDAVSGCRCNCVEVVGTPLKLQYTPDGGSIILLTQVRRHIAQRLPLWG